MRKLKKGDTVVVTVGKDKGKKGTISKVVSKVVSFRNRTVEKCKVFVEGVNLVKRHTKGNPSQGKVGTILEKEASIDISNVAIFNASTGKADRVGFRILEDGRKIRVFKSNSEVIDI